MYFVTRLVSGCSHRRREHSDSEGRASDLLLCLSVQRTEHMTPPSLLEVRCRECMTWRALPFQKYRLEVHRLDKGHMVIILDTTSQRRRIQFQNPLASKTHPVTSVLCRGLLCCKFASDSSVLRWNSRYATATTSSGKCWPSAQKKREEAAPHATSVSPSQPPFRGHSKPKHTERAQPLVVRAFFCAISRGVSLAPMGSSSSRAVGRRRAGQLDRMSQEELDRTSQRLAHTEQEVVRLEALVAAAKRWIFVAFGGGLLVGLLVGSGICMSLSLDQCLITGTLQADNLAPKAVLRPVELEGDPELLNAVVGLTLRLFSVANVLHLAGSIILTVTYLIFLYGFWSQPDILSCEGSFIVSVVYVAVLALMGLRLASHGDDGSKLVGGLLQTVTVYAMFPTVGFGLEATGLCWTTPCRTLGSPDASSLVALSPAVLLALTIASGSGVHMGLFLHHLSGFPLLMAPVFLWVYLSFMGLSLLTWGFLRQAPHLCHNGKLAINTLFSDLLFFKKAPVSKYFTHHLCSCWVYVEAFFGVLWVTSYLGKTCVATLYLSTRHVFESLDEVPLCHPGFPRCSQQSPQPDGGSLCPHARQSLLSIGSLALVWTVPKAPNCQVRGWKQTFCGLRRPARNSSGSAPQPPLMVELLVLS